MREDEFRAWLAEGGAESVKAQDSRIYALRKMEKNLPGLGFAFANLEEAYAADKFAALIQKLTELRANAREDGDHSRILLPQSQAADRRLSYWQSWLKRYGAFLSGEKHGDKDADRIRRHVLETYIEPAREREEDSVEVHVRTVHDALGLHQAWRNVCQSLTGEKFLEMADVFPPERFGAQYSPATRYRFDLAGMLRLDASALQTLKLAFEILHPDLTTFADCPSFAKGEGSYKHFLVSRAAELIEAHKADDDALLGAALLDLASGKGGLFSNLIDWRASGMVDEVRASHPGIVEGALGRMARSADEPASAVIACVDALWPAFIEGRSSKPYAESRMVPTMVMGLVRPDAVLGIRSTPTDNAHKMLLAKPAFAWNRLTRPELDSVLAMAGEIFRAMRDDWGWAPRDMWDVQGFIWETCQKIVAAEPAAPAPEPRIETPMPSPTNLILYGPPGTGKTFTTARDAVRLCDGEAGYPETPEGRAMLMTRYRELEDEGRIRFCTFHQSYSYEDFVEGLRPPIDTPTADGPADDQTDAAGGLRLTVHDGLFKVISNAARLDHGVSDGIDRFDRERRVFKVSLGRRHEEEDQIRQALDAGEIHLGWGGEIDWSDERFDNFGEILEEWRRQDPEATGKNANVEMMFAFRALMEQGDYVLVSDGRDKVRAIGRIAGEYRYAPGTAGHPHRRKAQWLWRDDAGIARDTIYPMMFRQHSVYEVRESLVDWDAMDALVFNVGKASPADARAFVLVIDEINRGNISKIFGELITLIEGDKRLGCDNALEATLPYSQKPFGVPANLHIIGTMNTADRSIALLDTALRRRFTFREMAPDPSLLKTVEGIALPALLTAINDRIEYLVDREHRIGHAFFIHCHSRADVDAVMRDKVIPLLQEYFFEDWSQIAAVVGPGFIARGNLKPPPGMKDQSDRPTWSVRPIFPANAYASLVDGVEVTAESAADDAVDEPE